MTQAEEIELSDVDGDGIWEELTAISRLRVIISSVFFRMKAEL